MIRDQVLAVANTGSDVHKSVYGALLKTGQRRDFIYSRTPYETPDGQAVVLVRRNRKLVELGSYAFSLTACPQVRRTPDGPKHVPDNDGAVSWLERQFEINGAKGVTVAVLDRSLLVLRNKKIPTIEFGGEVRVTDSESFSDWLTRGTGKARAYGLGMMMLSAS